MRKDLAYYETMKMEQDAQEAVAAEKAWLKAGGDRGGQPDQGYNQWISFNFKFEDFPQNYCLALKSMDDVDIHCGKLFVGNKDIELEPGFLPLSIFSREAASYSRLGACGRYCAAMGKVVLREQTDKGMIGKEVVSIIWKCLYQSYSKNVLYAIMHSRDYEVEYNHDYPKDTAIGEVTIHVKHIAGIS